MAMKFLPAIFAVLMLCTLFGFPLAQSICGEDSIAVILELDEERDAEDIEDAELKNVHAKYFRTHTHAMHSKEMQLCNFYSSSSAHVGVQLSMLGVDTPPPECSI